MSFVRVVWRSVHERKLFKNQKPLQPLSTSWLPYGYSQLHTKVCTNYLITKDSFANCGQSVAFQKLLTYRWSKHEGRVADLLDQGIE